jgi:hypothetical protein
MHRKLSGRAVLTAAALTVSCALATTWTAGPAEAAGGTSCPSSGGSSGGGGGSGSSFQIWVALNKTTDMCANGGNASQTDGTGGATVHIPCWWGPAYDPAGLAAYVDGLGESAIDTQFSLQQEYDKNGTFPLGATYVSTQPPPWESYNVGATPTGEWYGLILNNGDTSDELTACMNDEDAKFPEIYYWVPTGQPPTNVPTDHPGFTPLLLAEYIESVINLPYASVSTNQRGAVSTVGLPVWYWQEPGANSLEIDNICAFGVCVDLHAQAVSFTITPGAAAARNQSGCTLNSASGVIGIPYTGGSGMSACSVEYQGPVPKAFRPVVMTTWKVAITWPGGSWSPPDDPVITTALGPITVQEIQAVNQTGAATPTG